MDDEVVLEDEEPEEYVEVYDIPFLTVFANKLLVVEIADKLPNFLTSPPFFPPITISPSKYIMFSGP